MEFVYEVHGSKVKIKPVWVEAKSMIDAARKFLGVDGVAKLSNSDLYSLAWDCKVYKYAKDNLRVPYNEGYYRVRR